MQLIELIVYPYTINYRVKTAYLCAFVVAVRINCINCMKFWILTSVIIMSADSSSSHLAFLLRICMLLQKGGGNAVTIIRSQNCETTPFPYNPLHSVFSSEPNQH